MSTYEYVDADGRAHTLIASSPALAMAAAFRFERDRTHDLALADMAAGTVEPVALAGTCYPGSPAIGRALQAPETLLDVIGAEAAEFGVRA